MFPPSSDKFRIVMLGAGNVATQLTRSLANSGHSVVQVYSRSVENAKGLARIAKCDYTIMLNEINTQADIYILAIPDSAIVSISKKLAKVSGTVVHTSGSTPLSAIAGPSDHLGVFYPFQTFTKSREISLDNVPFCIEGSSKEVINILFNLATSLGGRPIEMNTDTRQWLHLSGVFSCNFVNHMLTIAQLIAEERGFDFNLLKPLINETIGKALKGNPIDSQTGPAVRGDAETIKRHIAMLSELDEDIRELYAGISSSIWSLKNNIE